MADGKGQMADGRWQMADGRWQMADGRWQMADGRWQMADGKWQIVNARCGIDQGAEWGMLPMRNVESGIWNVGCGPGDPAELIPHSEFRIPNLKRRPAFTLIELLVVMGIIAILVAFLLPAFLAARGASRRISCVNNLKEIDLAIQGYLTTHNVLPSGSYDASGPVPSTPDARAVSWIVSILPYMEQTGLYRAFDPVYGANDPENHTVAMARLSTLTCPAERPPGNIWLFGAMAPRGPTKGECPATPAARTIPRRRST